MSQTAGPVRALLLLGSSSVVTIIAGMASAKVAAVLIGSDGVGLLALVLTTVSLVNTLLTAGVGQILIRRCGLDEASDSSAQHGGWVVAARQVILRTGIVALAVSVLVAPRVSESLFGAETPSWWLPGIVAAAVSYSWLQLHINTLVAHHLVSVTTRAAVAVAFVSPAVNAVFFTVYGVDGVVPGAIATNAISLLVVAMFVWRSVDLGPIPKAMQALRRQLLREGVPLVPVALLGGVATLIVLLLVDKRLSREQVGYFRAASTISLAYIAFLATSISQDFFPRLARTADDHQEFARLCNEQIRLILYFAAPIIVAVNTALPVIVPILYSQEFAPAVDVLEWQVVGDLLRLSASVFATALLVRAGSVARLGPELVGSVSMVCASIVGLGILGFRGLGVGYVAAYIVYTVVLVAVLKSKGYLASLAVFAHLGVAMACVASVPIAVLLTGRQEARLIGAPVALALALYTVRTLGTGSVLARFRLKRSVSTESASSD